ncbi:hypothetical protein Tco_0832149 [Tanacetum coccineum]
MSGGWHVDHRLSFLATSLDPVLAYGMPKEHSFCRPKYRQHKLLGFFLFDSQKLCPPAAATLVLVGNFIMPYVVDGTSPRARILSLPLIPLYYEGDLTTKKFIYTVNWYGYFPKDTRRSICHVISLENPTNGTEAGIRLRLISGFILRKQCSYRISEALLPSTHSGCHMANPLSFVSASGFYSTLLVLALLLSYLISLTRCASCLDLTSSSICLFICKQSSRLYPLSPWKLQYLFLFLDFGAPNIGGEVIKVPFPASIASISLGVFMSGVNQSFLQSIGRRLKSFAQSFALGMVYGNLVASTVVPFFWID